MPLRSKHRHTDRPVYPERKRFIGAHQRWVRRRAKKSSRQIRPLVSKLSRADYQQGFREGSQDAQRGWPNEPCPGMSQDYLTGYDIGFRAYNQSQQTIDVA